MGKIGELFEAIARGDSLPEAYHDAIETLYTCGTVCDCENQDTKSTQKELSMTMVVENPLAEPMISRLWIGGPYDLARYLREMLDGEFDFCIGNGWDYTYHDRMANFRSRSDATYDIKGIDQIKFVIDELKRCPYSRRAVISIRSDYDMRTDATDPACLQHIHYFIRDNKLHCKVLFRSNDAVEATFMNAFALIMLQKKIADELGVEVGSYTHRANSFHCYEKNFKDLEGYVQRIRGGKNLTFDYIGEFDEMIEEAQKDVDTTVNKLKERIVG